MYLDRIFNLIDIIKNKFKKKTIEQDLDDYLDSEMPGELDKIIPYTTGVNTDEQFEKIRKDL